MNRKLLLFAVCATIAASASLAEELIRSKEDGDQQCRTTSATVPPKGEWLRVIPGEVLLAAETLEECLWARPKADARVSEAGAYVKKGTLLWNAGPGRFCLRETATRFCLHDKAQDGRFDKSSTMGGSRGVNLTTPYEEVWLRTGSGEGDHRRELVLLELGADRLRAALREGGGSSNEVSYQFGETGEVSLGNLRAEVRRVEGGVEVRIP